MHRVQAVCWPRGPAAPPRAAASQGRLCVHSCPVGSPHPHPSAPTQAPARRPAGAAPSARRQRPQKGPAERRAAFQPSGHTGARPSLTRSLAPGGLPRRRQPSTCEGKAPGLPPLLPGRRVPIASRRQRSSPGRGEGPPGSGAGQGAGPWKGKARDREGLTQATLRALRSLRKGRGRLASKRGPRAEEGEVQTKAKEGRDDSS